MSKRLSRRVSWLTLTLGAALAGCQEPDGLMPAVAPGEDPRRVLAPKEEGDNASQAVGEYAAQLGSGGTNTTVIDVPLATPTKKGEVKTTESGVKYETIKEGSGAVAKPGQHVTVHYVGTLEDGRKFDSSREGDRPREFQINTGKLIKAWDEAIPGMRVGEVRKLTVPPNAGYGAQGRPPAIPPNATLFFEVELIGAK
jgi:FKBP-type peptidyl-prolyl cis-trans isomerase